MKREDEKRMEYRIPADMVIDQMNRCGLEPEHFKASIRELSASGCRLQSSLNMELGQVLEISFDLGHGHRINCAKAKVIRRLSHRSHRVVAMEFIDLPEEDQCRIREFVVWKESQEEKS